ncbi:MAG TPA: hypothetical protein DEB06_09630 [Phycisphaerales bacterium]|nr:hypothetical protein [Phycisphaerales bacterium]
MQGQEAMREATGKTIDLVRLLSEKGAPDGAILRVGHAGKERVNRIAASHAARINAEAERCLRLLRALSAPPEAGQAILEARRRSLAGLREAAERSCMAIVRAVQAAIEDGEGEGEAAVSDAA